MPKRWAIGGFWAVLVSAGLFACGRDAAAEQPTKTGKIVISDVIIAGNNRMSSEEIKTHLHTQPGKEYNPASVDDDVRELSKNGRSNTIRTYLYPDGNERVKIVFVIREKPKIVQKVTFRGAKHIKTEDLHSITGVLPGTPLDPNLNHVSCLKILEKYAEMGRSFADCQLIKGGDLADNEVVYEITEGPKVRVRDIRFVGDFHFVSAARLTAQAKSSRQWIHHIGGIYNKQKAETDVGILTHYFGSFGFQDVRISLESQRSADGSEVTLIFHIHEGDRYRVQEVPDVHGSQDTPREQLIALSSFKPGDYLDEETMKQDIKAITDYMGARGVNVLVMATPVWSDTPGVCNVRYEIIEGASRIGKIRVSGNKRISNESILAHVPLQPGQILSAPALQQAEKNLAELGLFVADAVTGVWPTITVIDSDAGEDVKDLLITVKQKPKAKRKRTKPGE